MNRNLSISLLLIFFGSIPFNVFSQTNNSASQNVDTVKEDKLIQEVVKSKEAPKKDKVQYFSQVTKYGFKNLFSNYNYNPSMSYTAQVNPNAENFVQDYMKAHGEY